MNKKEWLDSLKPGDTFKQILSGNGRRYARGIGTYTVAKRTKTQIVMACGTRIMSDTGKVVGYEYSYFDLPPSEDVVIEIERQIKLDRICNALSSMDWRKKDSDTLIEVARIVGIVK